MTGSGKRVAVLGGAVAGLAAAHRLTDIERIGDADGIATRYQGEGIVQAIRSAYLLGELLEEGG